jgi:hypothetical protein
VDLKVEHLLLEHSQQAAVVVAVARQQQQMDSHVELVHQYMDVQAQQAETVEAQVNFGTHTTLVLQELQRA